MNQNYFKLDGIKIVFTLIIFAILLLLPVVPIIQPMPCLIAPCPEQITTASPYTANLWAFATFITYFVIVIELIIAYILASWIKNFKK